MKVRLEEEDSFLVYKQANGLTLLLHHKIGSMVGRRWNKKITKDEEDVELHDIKYAWVGLEYS